MTAALLALAACTGEPRDRRPPPPVDTDTDTDTDTDSWRLAEPLEAQAPVFLVEAAPSDGQLADPETVTLGAQVYVFYTRVWAGGDQLFRASVPL